MLRSEIRCYSVRELDQMAHFSAQLTEAPPMPGVRSFAVRVSGPRHIKGVKKQKKDLLHLDVPEDAGTTFRIGL